MEIQSKDILERLIEAISTKYSVIVKLYHFSKKGYCLIYRNSNIDSFGTYVPYREKSTDPGRLYFKTTDEFLSTLLNNGKLYVYASNGDIIVDVNKEFGKTIEELEISCDLLLKSKS